MQYLTKEQILLIDGNKRTALTCAGVFLENNGYKLEARRGEIEKFGLKVVNEQLELNQIAAWLKRHSKKIKRPSKPQRNLLRGR